MTGRSLLEARVARAGRRARLRPRGAAALGMLAACALVAVTPGPTEAQTRFMYLRGQSVSPAFEGWWPNPDGSFELFFGYMNTNWEEHLDVPVGPDNYFAVGDPGALDDPARDAYDPSGADRGQPTHFYPRRNPFLFTVRVPPDFESTELVWTLTTKGETRRAYASTAPDYRIDPQVISTEVGGDFGSLSDALRTNVPPELEVEGPDEHSIAVGEPLELTARARDPDGIPARRDRGGPPGSLEALYRPPSSIVAISGPGLRLSWIVYRGPERHVTFDPVQMKTWTDTRAYANSPWSPPWTIPPPPPDGRWVTEARFEEPGEYLLRAVASDGSLFTYRDVRVSVRPLAN